MKRTILTVALAAATILPLAVHAQANDFPKKGAVINLIVPFPPGGAADMQTRLLGQKLAELWGVNAVVQNKPGGDMAIGLQQVARSEPDGHTIGVTTSSFGLNKTVRSGFPLDPVKDFAPIGLVGQSGYVLAVHADTPYKTFKELEVATQAKGNDFNYATCCLGPYFATEMIKTVTGLKGMHIPYKGSSPALNAALSKDVDFIVDTTTIIKPQVDAGKLRPLLVTGRANSVTMPDVPHLGQAGMPGTFDVGVWYGWTFPAGTPKAIVDKTNAALNQILAMPDVKAQMERLDILVTPTTPDEMQSRVVADLAQYEKTIKEAKLTFGQ